MSRRPEAPPLTYVDRKEVHMEMNGVAPCGIDCANCELYEANGRREVWERAAARLGGKPEAYACKGCRAGGGCSVHSDCETRACAVERGVVFCHSCESFPCRRLMPIAEGASFYPHNLKLYNLGRIAAVGPEAFLAEATENRRLYFKGRFKIGAGPQEP